ncbi:hypothetical protein [Kitasatospora sp. GP82]|uniref:hypothetical protein n=1 Tax=Kitasatospora sp. GP82 TaxID=3035089 RepID=UPI002477067A|nr:hypothetical protein [Kitasatospora sp. GP82]MDH6129657.1 hypothetical protein [Kitasatospora sp. GP82]
MSSRGSGTAVTVSIEDITAPATFNQLSDALVALWEALRVLPLGWTQYQAYRYFFGPGAEQRVAEFLERDGELTLSFTMAGRSHAVRVVPQR